MQDQDLTSSPQPEGRPLHHTPHPAMHFGGDAFSAETSKPGANVLSQNDAAPAHSASPAVVGGDLEHEPLTMQQMPEQSTTNFEPQPAVVTPTVSSGPPQPPVESEPSVALPTNSVNPVPVIQVLSTRGVEYLMFTIMLWASAIDLGWILLALINGGANFEVLSFPIASFVVALPIFGYLLVRLKSAEFANPALRIEPSKRRLTQITQAVTFLICFVNLVAFVYLIMVKISGQFDFPLWKMVLDVLVVLGIAGGILAYYWFDEHKDRQ